MMLSRRGVLRCLTGIIAAPAIVRADALMRVVSPKGPVAKYIVSFDLAKPDAMDILAWQADWVVKRIMFGNPDMSFEVAPMGLLDIAQHVAISQGLLMENCKISCSETGYVTLWQ